ncbi:MAG: sulfate adenylyltransferase subunit CysN [Planctomycetes bacterium]|nr:sulfate adenylyltransferase subunit CysN [Planctomycetota bacterium]MCC7399760.1 sulfate adenylyltransferase subunit CysN [Planctomycetota bacterium]
MSYSRQLDEQGIDTYLQRYGNREMLRLLTCGSVDDGKSTLIGRLLYDSQMVFDDVLRATKKASEKFGTTGEEVDLALLVDGLQAEREQGITIDVAYRYFATERRKFIIADTPGHVQYTRNMATGASNCDLAVILIDARHGVLEQTRRHSFICSLLGIQHFVIAVNKMDLVGYSEARFQEIREAYSEFAARLGVRDIHFIPLSALKGENVVHRGASMPWFQGSPLLDHLETVHVASDKNFVDLRFPVQNVVRPNLDFRGFAGTLASGVLRVGDRISTLPSGKQSQVKSIVTFDGELAEAFAGMAITVTLTDEIDISRGDMIVAPNNAPPLENSVEAMLVWFSETPLQTGKQYLVKHTTAMTSGVVGEVRYRINVGDLHREPAQGLQMNEVGRIRLECTRPLAADAYAKNRATGAFILIDRLTNATVGAGMIVERKTAADATQRRQAAADAGRFVRMQAKRRITPEARKARLGQEPFVLWITGLPRSGKTSLAYALEEKLFEAQRHVQVLDGELLRLGLNRDLGFSGADRWENQRRAAELARLNLGSGISTIVALVSPLEFERQQVRAIVGADRFLEVFCDAPLAVCEARDHDGLYARARAGEIQNVTGVDAPYEPPQHPELTLDTAHTPAGDNLDKVLQLLRARHLLP